MVFLDTNVFLYASGRDVAAADAATSLLTALAEGEFSATTNTEVVQEVLHVVGRRQSAQAAVAAGKAVLGLVGEPLAVTGATIRAALDILAQHPGMSPRDAIHAATMRAARISVLVSADKDFDRLGGIVRLDPREPKTLAALRPPRAP